MSDPLEEELAQLRAQNESLHEQVKQLVKMEKRLYLTQNDMDRQLFRINLLNKFNLAAGRTHDPESILQLATDMLVKSFWLEQGAAFLMQPSGLLAAKAFSGFSEAAAGAVGQMIWSPADYNFYDFRQADILRRDAPLESQANALKLLEYLEADLEARMPREDGYVRGAVNVLLPLRRRGEQLVGLIIARKVDGRTFSYHAIPPGEKDVPFLTIIQAHIESALQNAFFWEEMTRAAATLEKNVLERTRDLQQANQELQATQERVVRSEKLAAIGQLAASVAHELRNPLGAIRNTIFYIQEALKGSPLEEDGNLIEMVKLADQEAQGAANIIQDLLDYSRIVKLTPQPTDVNALLRVSLRKQTPPAQVSVVENLDEGLPSTWLDPQKMAQVFSNLITNAMQAMPKGGEIRLHTRTRGHDSPEEVLVVVEDTGTGIASDNLNRIFDPLFTTKAKGTGLGLTISQGIVEAHGGKIEVTSVLNKGTTFTVRLPIKKR